MFNIQSTPLYPSSNQHILPSLIINKKISHPFHRSKRTHTQYPPSSLHQTPETQKLMSPRNPAGSHKPPARGSSAAPADPEHAARRPLGLRPAQGHGRPPHGHPDNGQGSGAQQPYQGPGRPHGHGQRSTRQLGRPAAAAAGSQATGGPAAAAQALFAGLGFAAAAATADESPDALEPHNRAHSGHRGHGWARHAVPAEPSLLSSG